MSDITSTTDAPPQSVREAYRRSVQAPLADETQPDIPPKGRIVQDTVTLSEGGEKVVNLNRGNELAAELKRAPVDANFAATLKSAMEDVMRIGQLFTQTVRTLFNG
ncbi:MAG: hypothetical protein HQL36_09895 [Alphaproteobacteria bacterium]|nr:hypothetical protein [Alphaproteobacteria bacterium]MBF0251773.1 hypothetical protein [Alphaproteobacteria bacterium]